MIPSISYNTNTDGTIAVYLETKQVGYIKEIQGGFAYFPKSSPKVHGTIYPTLVEVKHSIETGDEQA